MGAPPGASRPAPDSGRPTEKAIRDEPPARNAAPGCSDQRPPSSTGGNPRRRGGWWAPPACPGLGLASRRPAGRRRGGSILKGAAPIRSIRPASFSRARPTIRIQVADAGRILAGIGQAVKDVAHGVEAGPFLTVGLDHRPRRIRRCRCRKHRFPWPWCSHPLSGRPCRWATVSTAWGCTCPLPKRLLCFLPTDREPELTRWVPFPTSMRSIPAPGA